MFLYIFGGSGLLCAPGYCRPNALPHNKIWYSRRTQQAQAQWAKNWEFVPKDHVCLKLFLSNNDGFRGEWFKVSSSDGSFLQCTIDGWIDGDNNISNDFNVPKYQDFSCSSLSVNRC